MVKCKICGRKFKSARALGGHMSTAHPQSLPDEVQNGTPAPAASEAEDESVAAEIRHYIAQGYNFEQLTKQLHFPDTSVRREMAKGMPPASEEDSNLPATYKQTEVINPEALLRRYSDGSYEDELELRGMVKLRAAMLMVMDLANIQKTMAEAEAKRLEPLLKVLREGRDELDAAAARARGQSFEMAQEAAEGAVSRVMGYIDQKLPKGPPPKDASELITKRIDKMWDMMEHMMESKMFPAEVGKKAPEGWEYEGPPSQSQPSPQPQASQSQAQPQGEQTEEEEEHSDD